jgi:DNA mismatch endonuclease (patch repair protein)
MTRAARAATHQTDGERPKSANRESWASSDGVRRSMRSNRGRDTRPELILRSTLHADGLRFYKHLRPLNQLRCEADVLFPRWRVAVFVDGCFWHVCPIHATFPATHREFWDAKLARNRARDDANNRAMSAAGWLVVRLWEHQTISEMHSAVVTALQARGHPGRVGSDPVLSEPLTTAGLTGSSRDSDHLPFRRSASDSGHRDPR